LEQTNLEFVGTDAKGLSRRPISTCWWKRWPRKI